MTALNRSQLQDIARKYARTYGVPEDVAVALLSTESNFNPYAVSRTGAMGVGQLMPQTAVSLGVNDPFNAEENIRGAMEYLGTLIRAFKSEKLGVAAYNAGPGAVRKYKGVPPFKETIGYVARISKKVGRELT